MTTKNTSAFLFGKSTSVLFLYFSLNLFDKVDILPVIIDNTAEIIPIYVAEIFKSFNKVILYVPNRIKIPQINPNII